MNVSLDFTSKRPHLTKDERMPRCYKDVEKIIKSVQTCKNNFKTVMANSRFRGAHFKKVYGLSLNVLKYYNYIQKIIDKTEILNKETFLRRETVSVLIYELIYGKGYLPGGSKVVTIVQAYENDIFKAHQEFQNNAEACELNEIYIPRYVRVHTLKTTVAYVIKDLENYGFKQILYEDISEEKYMELVRGLERGAFLVDFHFKDILVFAQDENLIDLDLYKNGHIFLQDKASYIPVHVLNPEPGSTVLDACAAPGMKSTHIASKMENKGILIACERDKKRFEILKETLEYGSVKIAKTLCTDFKLIDPNDESYKTLEYILLDPSCSGSGMVNRMDEVTNNEDSMSKERIQKLAGFQIILLKHALKFPSVKRVVYSTCSIHEEENEYVVHEALSAFENSFKLVPALPEWFSRGIGSYQYSEMCLRTVPSKHLTNGFFVAVFERIDNYEHKDKYSKKYKKFKSSREDMRKIYNPGRKTEISPDRKTKSRKDFKQEKESYEYRESNKNIECNLFYIDKEGSSKRIIEEEENCEYIELNENIENSLNDKDISKERAYHLSNHGVANVEYTKHKHHTKKSKKSKYVEHTNIEKGKEQEFNNHHCQKEKERNDYLDSFSRNDGTSIVQDPTILQMSSELDNNNLQGKKPKHKKSHRSEKNFEIAEESCQLISEHKSKKKKKRKHSEISYDTFPSEEQNNFTNSDTSELLKVSKSNNSFNNNNIEHSNEFIAGEDLNLETSPKKHKKKKKKEHHEVDVNLESWNHNNVLNVNTSDVQNSKHSNEIANFSSQESSDFLQHQASPSKKHKKKKKKRDHEDDENSGRWNHNKVLNVNPSNVQNSEHSDEIVNFSSQENSDLLQHQASPLKKHKKKKKKKDHEVDESL